MGVETHTMAEFTSPVAPARLFKAMVVDNSNIMPKVVPQFIQSIDFVQGDSTSVGCIKQLNFPQGAPFKYVKNRVNEIDFDNFYVKYTSIEGDVLGDRLECAVYEHKYEASGSASSYKMIAHYHTKGDYVMKEGELAKAKENIEKIFKAMEEYLIANPQVYA